MKVGLHLIGQREGGRGRIRSGCTSEVAADAGRAALWRSRRREVGRPRGGRAAIWSDQHHKLRCLLGMIHRKLRCLFDGRLADELRGKGLKNAVMPPETSLVGAGPVGKNTDGRWFIGINPGR